MILDDLFNLAAQQFPAVGQGQFLQADAGVTTNQTGGLQTQTNAGSAYGIVLNYHPSHVVDHAGRRYFLPAAFSAGTDLTISAYPFSHYVVEMDGTSFAANVDPATNIVFGVVGQQFVTISLCNLHILS